MGFALAGVGPAAAAASNKSISIANRHRRSASSACGSNVIGRTVLINQPLTHLLNKSRFTPAIKSVALHSKTLELEEFSTNIQIITNGFRLTR